MCLLYRTVNRPTRHPTGPAHRERAEMQIAEIGLAQQRLVVSGCASAFLAEHRSKIIWIFVELRIGLRSDGRPGRLFGVRWPGAALAHGSVAGKVFKGSQLPALRPKRRRAGALQSRCLMSCIFTILPPMDHALTFLVLGLSNSFHDISKRLASCAGPQARFPWNIHGHWRNTAQSPSLLYGREAKLA